VTVTEYLFVQLTEEPPDATWVALDGAGHLLSAIGRGSLQGLRSAVEGRRVVLLVPATDVISTQVQLPAGSQSRLRQILPYSLEETFAEDVEDLLFAAGPRLESGAVSAAIVANERMDAWLGRLRDAGVSPHAVYSEADGVPEMPDTLTLIVQGDRVYGRRPALPPFVLEGFGLDQVLELVRGNDEDVADLRQMLVYIDEPGHGAHQSELVRLQDRGVNVEVKLLADGMLARIAATLVHKPGTNLLQGPYAPKSNWVALARPWRVAAGLLIATGALAIVSQGAEYLSLRRADGELAAQIAASCQSVVAATRLAACEAEVQRRLRAAGGGAGSGGETFLTTLAAVADSRGPDSRIESLSYRNRVMDLQLVASSVPSLDGFARALEETRRFEARLEQSSPNQAGIEGRIQVVEAKR
jgi:general secretion pathway protein L